MNHPMKLAALLCLLSTPVISFAHPTGEGHAHDSSGAIARDGFGECVKTPRWDAANTLVECGGVAPVAKAAPPVAKAPAPAPAPAPSQPAFRTINLGADVLFDSNYADLKPGAQPSLDKLVADLNQAAFDKVSIIGHADHLSSDAYNQSLSERRANTVRNYLVSGGIPAEKLSSEGMGERQPVTKPGECNNLKKAALRDCLAPDRRVEIRIYNARVK